MSGNCEYFFQFVCAHMQKTIDRLGENTTVFSVFRHDGTEVCGHLCFRVQKLLLAFDRNFQVLLKNRGSDFHSHNGKCRYIFFDFNAWQKQCDRLFRHYSTDSSHDFFDIPRKNRLLDKNNIPAFIRVALPCFCYQKVTATFLTGSFSL